MADAPAPIAISDAEERKKIINRLRRLEGQVRGLQQMTQSDKECEAVLTQVMAVKSALQQVGMHVIGHAMKTCLVDENLTDRDELVTAAFSVFLHYRELAGASESAPRTDLASPTEVAEQLMLLEREIHAVQEVIDSQGDCETALRELTAAASTLNNVALAVLGHAMHKCLISENPSSRNQVIDEAIAVFLRYSSCVR
jgi:CsoR family transcriptional regulator, copper-sensing transcriptional repressor